MSFKNEVAKILRETREKKRLTQEEVAKKAGISTNYYARVERGGTDGPEVRAVIVDKIAKALDIKIQFPLK